MIIHNIIICRVSYFNGRFKFTVTSLYYDWLGKVSHLHRVTIIIRFDIFYYFDSYVSLQTGDTHPENLFMYLPTMFVGSQNVLEVNLVP